MGAFGSCLGVGRPIKSAADPRFYGPNLGNIDPTFGGPNRQLIRPPNNSRQAYPPNGLSANGRGPLKILRQTSSLSNGNQQPLPFNRQSPSQTVPKLVDIDDSMPPSQSSHLNCNRKQLFINGSLQPDNFTSNPIDLFEKNIDRLDPSEIKNLIAIYDYDKRTEGDLGFQKGDHLETAKSFMVDDWWLARSKASGEVGYIPSNYVAELKSLGAEPWYFRKIGRADAESRLRKPGNEDGAFIIRDSDTTAHQYSLSLRHENDIKHYRIRQFESGGFYINRKKVFSTIHDLVLHYSNAPDGLCINLREPCIFDNHKPATAGLSHDTRDRWEIDRSSLKLLHELGRGQFGQVYEGLWQNKTRVAIKTLRKGSMDPQDFLGEAQIMKKMKHTNLVQLYAVCTREEPVYIVTELMSKGALISYLQTDEGKKLGLLDHVKMATQIADGMFYLEREKYVHRDLAARNILVGDNNICKIADFGLARFIKESEYEARAGARFPIKWTAPEAANFSKFTIKSDVWSFGIVLYEIISRGGTPYPDMSNAEVLDRIDKGYRMPQPPDCPAKYYAIMVECWNRDSNRRPTFETLHWKLADYFASDEQYKDASMFRDR